MESHGVDRLEAENIQKDPPTSSLVAGEIAYLYAHILQLTSHCLFVYIPPSGDIHVLKDNECTQLFKLLKGAAPSWGRIADELNFTFEDKIAITHTPGMNDDEGYFQTLLHRWLKREPHLTTVEVLANALHLAGEHRLAHDLEHNPDFISQDRIMSC